MQRTPWTKQNSSFPSDRIKPATKGPSNTPKKNKQSQHSVDPPKSAEVRRLEGLIQGVRSATGREKDPKGGCFCLARLHDLSSYTALCRSCGLILCSVNLPHYACPSCETVLLSHSARELIVAQLEAELASTNAKEIQDKERAIQDARQVAGAFPTLSGSSPAASALSTQPTYPMPSKQTHKVMSLTGGSNKRVVVSSFTTKSPTPSRPISRDEIVELEPERIPHPPSEPMHSTKQPSADRPFENLIKGGLTYKPKPRPKGEDGLAEGGSKPSRRKRNKGKGKEDGGQGQESEQKVGA